VAVCSFSVGVNERKKNTAGEWEDAGTSWYNVVTFRQLAEACAEELTKGSKVVVTGSLAVEEYEKDGEKRKSVKVLAEAVGVNVVGKKPAVREQQAVAADPWVSDGPAPF
jgi:single-strand DNA-binding protein